LIEDYPELPEPYNNLAVLYAQKGEYEGARIALESAVKTAPDWAIAHENLGDIYVRLGAAEFATAYKLDRTNKTAAAKLTLARELIAPTPKPAAATAVTPKP
jgi:Flp pilus assembly protein TadD